MYEGVQFKDNASECSQVVLAPAPSAPKLFFHLTETDTAIDVVN